MKITIHTKSKKHITKLLLLLLLIVTNQGASASCSPWAEIYLVGKVYGIFDGSTTISNNLSTNFDTASTCNPSSRIYEIDNPGSDPLIIDSIKFTGTNAADFSVPGISFPLTVPNQYLIKFIARFTPSGLGVRTARLHLYSNDCDIPDFDFAIQGVGATPTLGSYSSATVVAGGNILVNPSTPPSGTDILTATAPVGFNGTLTADPQTGIIHVVDAKPAGIYTITVSEGTCNSQTFSLTVTNPVCSHAQFTNSGSISLGAGVNPSGIAIVDLNQDGIQDFVTANLNQNSISSSFGNGSGGFNPYSTVIADFSSSVAAGDFNRDGAPDLVMANRYSNTISIFIGDGSGNFNIGNLPTLSSLTVGMTPYFVVVGDFNGDLLQDIACANYDSNNITTYLGTGTGSFTLAGNTTVGTNPSSFAVGDFNQDGFQDLAVTNYTSNTVSILLGNNNGIFTANPVVSVGTHPNSICIGDFNSDGKQDFATSNNGSNNISIRFGNGLGGFTGTTNISVGNAPTCIVTGDLNGDGIADLAVSNSSSNNVSVLAGNGLGSFVLSSTTTVGTAPSSLAVGDFNLDGREDLLVTNSNSSFVTILKGVDREINLIGNGINIPDGNSVTSLSDNTNFGSASQCGSISKSFTIQNTGATSLIVSSISFTGANAGDFAVSGITFPATIAAVGSATFSVTFTPGGTNLRSAILHVNNDDCDETDYDFAVEGAGLLSTLGSYPNSSVTIGGNITVIPNASPTGNTFLSAYASGGFTGVVTADPVTGNINVCAANPPGTYLITVAIGTCLIETFSLIVGANTVCSQAVLGTPTNLAVANSPHSVAVGDFNMDGKEDLAIANASNTISIKLGNGIGGFTNGNTISTSNAPYSIAVGDFNSDGKQDLAVAAQSSSLVHLFIGNGLGSFSSIPSVSVGTSPVYVVVGDFNRDGKQDLATVNSGSSNISIRLGDGNGNFSNSGLANGGNLIVPANPTCLAIGDFNSDKKPDIAVTNYNTTTSHFVTTLIGNGFGDFTVLSSITVPNNPNSIATADFNGDGKLDFATASSSGSVAIRLGNGLGGFTGSTNFAVAATTSLTIGDLNGDGKMDVAALSQTGNSVSIITGLGNGNFNPQIIATVSGPVHLTTGDFNNDGIQDIATANLNNATSSVLLGTVNEINVKGNNNNIVDGNNVTSLADYTNFGSIGICNQVTKNFLVQNTGAGPLTVSAMNFSGANASLFSIPPIAFPIVVAAGGATAASVTFSPSSTGVFSATLHILNNDCDENDYDFAIEGTAVTPTLGTYPSTTLIAGGNTTVVPNSTPTGASILSVSSSTNFNGVFTADPVTGNISIVDARPAGTYVVTVSEANCVSQTFNLTVNDPLCSQSNFTSVTSIPTGSDPRAAAIGDFNGDGFQDVAIANSTSNTISIKLGNGTTFTGSTTLTPGGIPFSIAIGDFNRDGKQDLAVANNGTSTVAIFLGNGLGGFNLINNISVGSGPYYIALGDFNNDSKLDFATANYTTNTISIRLGDGLGNFSGTSNISVGSHPQSVAIGDFNGDNKQDFAASNYGSTTVSIKLGDGFGGFSGTTTINVGTAPYNVVLADFNGDGKQDFATSNYSSHDVSIRMGDGMGGFSGTTNINVGAATASLAIGDFNGDGKQDIAAARSSNNSVSILIGDGAGGFTAKPNLSSTSGALYICVGDLNNDSRQDIVTANYDIGSFSFYLATVNEINLIGNSNSIADGKTSISLTDNTDFGNTSACGPVTKNFTIENTGTGLLTINNINLSGVNASDFSITGMVFPTNIAAGSSAIFNVTFSRTTLGTSNATVHINNDDCNESDYDFAIQGTTQPSSLGSYSNTTINSGGNSIIVPNVAPINVTNLSVSTSSNFTGFLTVNPSTGIVSVTNAGPAGVYTVKVSDYTCFNQTFTLTVTNPNCSQGYFILGNRVGAGSNPDQISIGDFNNDNKQDLAIANRGTNTISIRFGNGLGGFTGTSNITVGSNPYCVAVGEFNNDGNQDLLIANGANNNVTVLLGNGLGGFSSNGNISVGATPYFVAVGDFNGDKKQDFATANNTSNTISIRLGDGTGGFTSASDLNIGSQLTSLVIRDFNSDGKLDIATSNNQLNTASIFLGNGSGGFIVGTPVGLSGLGPQNINAADLNNDGIQDLVAASYTNSISIRFGNGNGTFNNTGSFTSGTAVVCVTPGDFNGDGKVDLAVGNSAFSSGNTYHGNGTGTFTQNFFLNDSTPYYVAVGEFNGDSIQDLAIGRQNNNDVIIYLGTNNEINLIGNSNNIQDGSNSFSLNNNTDFGQVSSCSPLTNNYIIRNTGGAALSVNTISITGANSSEFVFSGFALPSIIPAGGSASFNITFTPSVIGIRNAVVHIASNDCNEADYDFAIQGTGVTAGLTFSSCPGNLFVSAPVGFCTAMVTYNASANVNPAPDYSYSYTGATTGMGTGTGSGAYFNEGVTHIAIGAINSCGIDSCFFDITVSANTNDNNICTDDVCHTSNGVITNNPVNTNDNNVCTTDGCDTSTGIFHTMVNVDDNNSCTVDGCHPITGIYHNQNIEICNNGMDDDCDGFIDENCSVTLNLNLFIRGFYLGSGLMQPTIDPIFYPTLCDTLALELHNANYPYNLEYVDSNTFDIYGHGIFNFPFSMIGNSYYLVLKHRNAIETWSAAPVLIDSLVNYSFIDSASSAYGNNLADLGDGYFALWNGDVSDSIPISAVYQDGMIDYHDYSVMEQAIFNTYLGYIRQDLTGDGIVESLDYMYIENAAAFLIVTSRP